MVSGLCVGNEYYETLDSGYSFPLAARFRYVHFVFPSVHQNSVETQHCYRYAEDVVGDGQHHIFYLFRLNQIYVVFYVRNTNVLKWVPSCRGRIKIRFNTFRHWKVTYEYHRTKDILYVKQLLGHKTLASTMIYIDIEKAIYGSGENADFTSRAATSDKGARSLIEAGFEYVLTTPNGTMLFRKRK